MYGQALLQQTDHLFDWLASLRIHFALRLVFLETGQPLPVVPHIAARVLAFVRLFIAVVVLKRRKSPVKFVAKMMQVFGDDSCWWYSRTDCYRVGSDALRTAIELIELSAEGSCCTETGDGKWQSIHAA